MKIIQNIFVLASLLCILIISLLLVMLNAKNVHLDLFGMFFIEQSLGLLLVLSFVLGVIFALFLTFIPNSILLFKNKHLQKKIQD